VEVVRWFCGGRTVVLWWCGGLVLCARECVLTFLGSGFFICAVAELQT